MTPPGNTLGAVAAPAGAPTLGHSAGTSCAAGGVSRCSGCAFAPATAPRGWSRCRLAAKACSGVATSSWRVGAPAHAAPVFAVPLGGWHCQRRGFCATRAAQAPADLMHTASARPLSLLVRRPPRCATDRRAVSWVGVVDGPYAMSRMTRSSFLPEVSKPRAAQASRNSRVLSSRRLHFVGENSTTVGPRSSGAATAASSPVGTVEAMHAALEPDKLEDIETFGSIMSVEVRSLSRCPDAPKTAEPNFAKCLCNNSVLAKLRPSMPNKHRHVTHTHTHMHVIEGPMLRRPFGQQRTPCVGHAFFANPFQATTRPFRADHTSHMYPTAGWLACQRNDGVDLAVQPSVDRVDKASVNAIAQNNGLGARCPCGAQRNAESDHPGVERARGWGGVGGAPTLEMRNRGADAPHSGAMRRERATGRRLQPKEQKAYNYTRESKRVVAVGIGGPTIRFEEDEVRGGGYGARREETAQVEETQVAQPIQDDSKSGPGTSAEISRRTTHARSLACEDRRKAPMRGAGDGCGCRGNSERDRTREARTLILRRR